MDERIRIWNLLHDGEITAVAGQGTGTLVMFVSIPYLRRRMPPTGDSFSLTLTGVSLAEFRNSDGSTQSLAEAIEDVRAEILSTKSEAMPIRIETTMGQMTLSYQALSLALDTGQAITFELIAKVCDEYWAEWHARAEAARRDSAEARDALGDKLRVLREAQIQKSHPVANLVPGWFFSVVVTSDMAWVAEGKTWRGRVVSCSGVDGRDVLAKCAEQARALDEGSAGS